MGPHGSSWRHIGDTHGNSSDGDHVDSPTISSVATAESFSPDVQGEFQNIKDTVQKTNLSPEFRLNDAGNRSGIKRQDQVWANCIARSARYVETSIKLLSNTNTDHVRATDIENLFVVQLAHIKFLQEEFQSVLVKGLFDENTGKVFRSLQKNTSPLSQEAVQTLKNTTQIVQAQAILQQNQSSYSGNSGGFRVGFRGF